METDGLGNVCGLDGAIESIGNESEQFSHATTFDLVQCRMATEDHDGSTDPDAARESDNKGRGTGMCVVPVLTV